MRLNWGLENLEDFEGSDEEKIDKAYKLVQEIERRIDDLVMKIRSNSERSTSI